MTKHLLTALLAAFVTSAGLYAVQPIRAAVLPTPDRPAAATAEAPASWHLSMPPPQAPFDMTPITPFETVAAPEVP